MNSYFAQGAFPLQESVPALVITEKDKPLKLFGIPGPIGLSWGMWEIPDADNDEAFNLPPAAA